jgi:hypothetical protein
MQNKPSSAIKAQTETQHDDETVYHVTFKADQHNPKLRAVTALCGAVLTKGPAFTTGVPTHSHWVLCPICSFLYELNAEESKTWLDGCEQLDSNKKASHD